VVKEQLSPFKKAAQNRESLEEGKLKRFSLNVFFKDNILVFVIFAVLVVLGLNAAIFVSRCKRMRRIKRKQLEESERIKDEKWRLDRPKKNPEIA